MHGMAAEAPRDIGHRTGIMRAARNPFYIVSDLTTYQNLKREYSFTGRIM